MPACKNDTSRSYKGSEPSPKGMGYCAHAENLNTKRKGRDGNIWTIKAFGGVKRWVKCNGGVGKNSGTKYNLLSFSGVMVFRGGEEISYSFKTKPIMYLDSSGNLHFGNIQSYIKEKVIVPNKNINVGISRTYRIAPEITLAFAVNKHKYKIEIKTTAMPTEEQLHIYKLVGFNQPRLPEKEYTYIQYKDVYMAKSKGVIMELKPKQEMVSSEDNATDVNYSKYGITCLVNKKSISYLLKNITNANDKIITNSTMVIYMPCNFDYYVGKKYKKLGGFTLKDVLVNISSLYNVVIKNFGYGRAVYKNGKPNRYYYIYSPLSHKSIKNVARTTATVIRDNEVFVGLQD